MNREILSSITTSITEQDYLSVQKPAQYLGGEKNSVIKDPSNVKLRMALAFPDTYEVGMSHLGIQILYDLINRDKRSWAERVYMPLPDMEKVLIEKNIPLSTLESSSPLKAYDIVGFSLQYELCATNILGMLSLAGIPLFSSDRLNSDPIIIGGGPYAYHPEPIAPFFDAFFLGDAEEFIPELIELYSEVDIQKAKSANANSLNRQYLIERLSFIKGIYIPSMFCPEYNSDGCLIDIKPVNPSIKRIERRLLPTLEGAPYPSKPVVPNVNIIHNRLAVEVMRGCVRGCRFCQAGYLYRPQRERSPEEILGMIQDVLPQTGFEEVSLLSLSTADYCSIIPLLKALTERYGQGETLGISFPSTRVDALTPEVLEEVQKARRTSFTIAPEGGSQRLRDVINKGVSDEQIINTCSNVFKMGWSSVKLYFMIGLPTETDEDLQGIIDLAKRIKILPEASGKEITVSVSTHVPKAHTPFQWTMQIPPEETLRKQRLLSAGLKRHRVNFRYHDYFSTFLEGVFCRGGRELAPVIFRAWQLGARLDAWQDHLSEEIWIKAFSDCGIDPYDYLKERAEDSVLPWDHLDCGISKSWFLREYKRSLRIKTTPDCLTTSCSICGACDYDVKKNVLWPREETERLLGCRFSINNSDKINSLPENLNFEDTKAASRIRIKYKKSGNFRMLGHLELSTLFQRTFRRAEIPVCYSRGYHPLPRIVFGPPLPFGLGSEAEYLDIFLSRKIINLAELLEKIASELPAGLEPVEINEINTNEISLSEQIIGSTYQVEFLDAPRGLLQRGLLQNGNFHLLEDLSNIIIERIQKAKKGRKSSTTRKFILSEYITEIKYSGTFLTFSLLAPPQFASPSPVEIVRALSELDQGSVNIIKISSIFGNNMKDNTSCKSENKKTDLKMQNSVFS
ncbi:MAG TPA: TIGR03960 family B12-binding radical SAM protein [Oligoflexia bacterium]|nr:TIGR03960 family B12-binding radical SAM protein [Oligoflexia bacterium]HMP48002.1 TIGR03960 family B12-binding radical SAM protein [Oligoflexia bacterium]